MPSPHLRAYPQETVIAEKLHAMVVLGLANSRMKDYYDVWMLQRSFKIDEARLQRAIEATFARRRTEVPATTPEGLSDAFAAIHETVSDYYEAGVIGKQTMRSFDEACLTPVHAFTAEEIRNLREREQVSQAVFANHLNVTKDSVSQWERGAKRPAGPALKLLSLIEKRGLAAVA